MLFEEFPKIARLSREVAVTEKIDGTNAQIYIAQVVERGYLARIGITNMLETGDYFFAAGSRSRFITPQDDNHGFARWAYEHVDELLTLGPGRHFGEWWGSGIQRGYGLSKGEKRFSLFNVARWHQRGAEPYVSTSADPRQPPKSSTEAPACCHVVPVIYRGSFDSFMGHVDNILEHLHTSGSVAASGFMQPEGIVVFHTASGVTFKKTIDKDDAPKGFRQ